MKTKETESKNLSTQTGSKKELINTRIFESVFQYVNRELDLVEFEKEIVQLINLKIWNKEEIIKSTIGKLRYESYQYILGKETKERELTKKRVNDFIDKWNSEK